MRCCPHVSRPREREIEKLESARESECVCVRERERARELEREREKASERESERSAHGFVYEGRSEAQIFSWCCFTAALLLLYCCFTGEREVYMDMSRAEVTSLRASVLKTLLRLLRLGGLDIILLRGFVKVLKALLWLLRLGDSDIMLLVRERENCPWICRGDRDEVQISIKALLRLN